MQLGERLYHRIEETYQHCQTKGTYQYNVEAMGKRSLKNIALAYLTATKRPEAIRLAVNQFRITDNMTDRMGALFALNDYDGPERADMLDEFYHRR